MRYSLTAALRPPGGTASPLASSRTRAFRSTTEGLLKIAHLVESPLLRVNYDTGNVYLAGGDPYEGLKAVSSLLVHVHAKDITVEHADAERGKVTGTPVGCACGDGVIDWQRVVSILREANFSGVLSVECGTEKQAARSLEHLSTVLGAKAVGTGG